MRQQAYEVLDGLIKSNNNSSNNSGNGGGLINEDSIGILYFTMVSDNKAVIGVPQLEEEFEADVVINEVLGMPTLTIHNENLHNYLSDKYNITMVQPGETTTSYSNFNIVRSVENSYSTISYISLSLILTVFKQ